MDSHNLEILWVKTGPLFPLNTGGRKRTHAMLCELSRQHRVTYLAFRNHPQAISTEEAETDYAVEKIWLDKFEAERHSRKFFVELTGNALFSTLPYALDKYCDQEMEQAIRELLDRRKFDLIVCDFLAPAPNIVDLDTHCPKVLFQHNMESEIWRRLASNQRNPLTRLYFHSQYRRMKDAEQRLSKKFDGVITVSPDDSRFSRETYGLSNVLGDVPTGVDAAYFADDASQQAHATPKGSPPRIGFLGSMDWMPNIEAVEWFISDIFPEIQRRLPAVQFDIIGRNPSANLRKLADNDPKISVSGTVDDIRRYVKACDLVVVPLLSGGGTRIKILEALAMGVPVVSTTIGAEGLGLIDGEHLAIADAPGIFACRVSDLLGDAKMRTRLATRGVLRVESAHSWERAASVFLDHCEHLLR